MEEYGPEGRKCYNMEINMLWMFRSFQERGLTSDYSACQSCHYLAVCEGRGDTLRE